MNKIDRVEISGFWGVKEINIDFFPDVNFFIGVNGSGKTTVINMIAAALSADFATLDKLPFQKLKIVLSEVGGRKKPSIELEKIENDDSPYPIITYRVKEKASDKYKEYSLNESEAETMKRRRMPRRQYQAYLQQRIRYGVWNKLRSLVNVSWLSIHRASSGRSSREEENYESTVDQKLEELSNDLGKYFSLLSSKVSDEFAEFQRNIILSLLTEQAESKIYSNIKSFDLIAEKKAISDIFQHLDIGNEDRESKINVHFEKVREAKGKLAKSNIHLEFSELMAILSHCQIQYAAENWRALKKKQEKILQPKETFIRVLNALFQKKQISIDARNEIEVTTESGNKLSIRSLSSGEKQLIIILGEALLQSESPWVYIADEPELSLHVEWQEKLIENIRHVNPKAQIVCATHSPDVVSTFAKNIFDMGCIIK